MLDGYRAGTGGEHRSAPILLDLTASLEIPARTGGMPARAGTAYLSEGAAPWRCAAYLRLAVGGTELWLPVADAAGLLSALAGLVATARRAQEVSW